MYTSRSAGAKKFIEDLLDEVGVETIGVRLWNGTWIPDGDPCPADLVLKHPYSLTAMFRQGTELSLAESYLNEDFDIEGDMGSIFDLRESLLAATSGWTRKLRAIRSLQISPVSLLKPNSRGPADLSREKHSRERDKQAISYHYDFQIIFTPFSSVLVVLLGFVARSGNMASGIMLYSLGHSVLFLVAGTSISFVNQLAKSKKFLVLGSAVKYVLGISVLLVSFVMFYMGF